MSASASSSSSSSSAAAAAAVAAKADGDDDGRNRRHDDNTDVGRGGGGGGGGGGDGTGWIPFRSHRTSPDSEGGWTTFDVPRGVGGVHVLQMRYASRHSRPCRIRIEGVEASVGVAAGTTEDNDVPRDFLGEGFFDLGPAMVVVAEEEEETESAAEDEEEAEAADPAVETAAAVSPSAGCEPEEREGPTTRVSFRARREGEWPNVVAFRFVPENEVLGPLARSGGGGGGGKSFAAAVAGRRGGRGGIRGSSISRRSHFFSDESLTREAASGRRARSFPPPPSSQESTTTETKSVRYCSSRFQRSPTAVTFSFEIGLPCVDGWDGDDVEVVAACLRGKAVKFKYGEAHDSVTIDGDPVGDKEGGDNWPIVTFYAHTDYIAAMTLGVSTYNGEGAFNGLILRKKRGDGGGAGRSPNGKKLLAGARLVDPTWTYDRNRLGLNLWITAIYAPKNRPVSRYGLTLSSDDGLDFNPEEFEVFWDWLVAVKRRMVFGASDWDRGLLPEASAPAEEEEEGGEREGTEERIRKKMEPLHDFLLASFSCCPANPASLEGYLYGTTSHVSITFDVFSVCIFRLPDGETFESTLFVDGEQYDCEGGRLEEIYLTRNEILGIAISLALRDDDLLHQMGLAVPTTRKERKDRGAGRTLMERELLPLRRDALLFRGDYDNTVMARRVICILAMTGLRKVMFETVTSNEREEWDVYCLASASPSTLGRNGRRKSYVLSSAAVVCGFIQLLTPTFIVYRSVTAETEDLAWDTYIVRFLFGVYAIFFEHKTWEIDNEERVVAWLCFLPEFSTPKLILGMAINKLAKVVVSAGIVTILLRSYSVVDVTLNALALYFVLQVDNLLVDASALQRIRKHQRREYFNVKSKTAVEYRWPRFTEDDLPLIKDLPARYFMVASHHVTEFCMLLLSVGSIYMLIEPLIFGWDAVDSGGL